MKLLVISHKEVWYDVTSPSQYSTIGGFPYQIDAISQLADQTKLIVLLRKSKTPTGAQPIVGYQLSVHPLAEPAGKNLQRKLAILFWLPINALYIWKSMRKVDAVHAPVPGDIGMIGIIIALLQKKPLFVRHCGTWGEASTVTDRILFKLLEFIAGGKNVVLATGGSDHPPSKENPNIQWIFSTTLSNREVNSIPSIKIWKSDSPLKLVTVARLTEEKNVQTTIKALAIIVKKIPDTYLSIIGDGDMRPALEMLVRDLKLSDNIFFYGNLKHEFVIKVLTESHLFLFPTKVKEGFPKAVVEAMACGLPVIGSNISVIPYLIKDCGLALTDPSETGLANAVFKIIENQTLFEYMSSNARKKAAIFTLERWQELIYFHLNSAWDFTDSK